MRIWNLQTAFEVYVAITIVMRLCVSAFVQKIYASLCHALHLLRTP